MSQTSHLHLCNSKWFMLGQILFSTKDLVTFGTNKPLFLFFGLFSCLAIWRFNVSFLLATKFHSSHLNSTLSFFSTQAAWWTRLVLCPENLCWYNPHEQCNIKWIFSSGGWKSVFWSWLTLSWVLTRQLLPCWTPVVCIWSWLTCSSKSNINWIFSHGDWKSIVWSLWTLSWVLCRLLLWVQHL